MLNYSNDAVRKKMPLKGVNKLFLFALFIFSASCKKDTPIDPSIDIVGKWMIVSMDYLYYKSGKEVFRETLMAVNETLPTNTTFVSFYFQINTDGSLFDYDYNGSSNTFILYYESFSYKLSNNNNTIIITPNSGLPPTNYDFAFSDKNTITLTRSQAGTVGYRLSETSNYLYGDSVKIIRHYKRN